MGVRGLLSYVLRHKEHGAAQRINLVQEAHNRGHHGVTLLVDLLDFAAWFLPQVDQLAKGYGPDATYLVYGGEFVHQDEAVCSFVYALREVGIYLEFFVDAPRGCGLVDGAAVNWGDDARRRSSQHLDGAKAVRQWCRGERSDLPERLEEQRCPPALWYDQIRPSLARCGCQVWHLRPEEQAPLLSLGRNSHWGHVFGVVSDNIDWAIVRGIRLIPLACFDLDQDIRPANMIAMGGWPQIGRLTVSYTNSDLLAEHLRLGHPPKEEDIREAAAKGKGRGPVGHGNWPYKWWFDQVLVELAMLCGTESTTPLIQKHKLYAQIGLQMGADPVDAIVRWVRSQLYSNKLRWRELQLEGLSPVISDLVSKDREFELALQCSRATYTQSTSGVRAAQAELVKLNGNGKDVRSQMLLRDKGQEQMLLPEAASLFLRSADLANGVALDVCFEDVARNGSPLAQQMLADLRRLTYLLLRKPSVQEHGVMGDQRGAVTSHTVDLTAGAAPIKDLQAMQRWPMQQRWGVFRKVVEHIVLQAEKAAARTPDDSSPVPPVEVCVWDAYRIARDAGPFPPRTEGSFVACLLEYFVSLNLRPEKPLIREHEFDSVALMVALSYDASLTGAPLAEANDYEQRRLGDIKVELCNHLAYQLSSSAEFRLPIRAVSLCAWFQGLTRHLLDMARLLWLDVEGQGETPVLLPEPRELYSGSLLAALYLGGSYDEWELQMPSGDNHYRWQAFFTKLSGLRYEALQTPCMLAWKSRLLQSFRPGSVAWPTREQLEEEKKVRGGHGVEELPIDEHRERILKHVDGHRVTCIQGETGCGKSTRVPVYIMEDYFEKMRAGTVKQEDPFMVLCTQPRRIACISLANRVANCLKERVGDTIGYKISGDSNVRPGRTKLVYVTTGYLLQVLVNNPEQIRSYTHLILDEVHERDVDSDLLSLVVKLQMADYNFKLVIMSATLQGDLFTRYFSDKKMKTIFVGVKRYPVETVYIEQLCDRYGGRYAHDFSDRRSTEGTRGIQAPFSNQAMRAMRDAERCFGTGGQEAQGLDEEEQRPARGEFDDSEPSDSEDDDAEADGKPVAQAAAKPKRWRKEVAPQILRGLDVLVYELVTRVAQPGEGILVFLPGFGEISELHESLLPLEDTDREAHMSWMPTVQRPDCRFKVFVLHSLIPKDEQEGAVFDPPPGDTAHIILASNIAESSLTIPKVRVVIDFGLRRQLIYDKRRHMSCLVTTWVSQASAKQRIGRTGRVFEGVAIRLFTKQFHDSYMEEFDPPEMQTAPLEKLYANVKHLSSKLPEYQISPTEKRRRTPKELLQMTAQPPDMASIESSVEVLDQLGALTGNSEEAELTVLGHLMMSVPLDVHLCRLVIFGAIMGLPCEGVVCAAALSVQDPFTLPSHLIIKDPREYTEALKRSYETRLFFDHGHCSEPLMLRSLFVHWLSDFRKMNVDRWNRRGARSSREPHRAGFLRAAQSMSQKFAVVPKRIVHLATSVLDTATRTRKFIPQGSDVLRQLDALVTLMQAGDKWFSNGDEADAQLPKVEDLFCCDVLKLKALLVMAFTPQFMTGSTKVRLEDSSGDKNWRRKKQDKSKMEQLLDEILEQGLDPSRTVACVIEMPRGRGAVNRWHSRFLEDLKLTLEMITCGEKFSLVMPGDNKVLISFEEDLGKSAFENMKAAAVATLNQETGLVTDLPTGAHFIDLYGAGRWKFTVPMLNSAKIERERADKAEKEAREREAKEKEQAKERERKEREAREKEARERERRAKAEKKEEEARKEEARKEAEKKKAEARKEEETKKEAERKEEEARKAEARKEEARKEAEKKEKEENEEKEKGEEKEEQKTAEVGVEVQAEAETAEKTANEGEEAEQKEEADAGKSEEAPTEAAPATSQGEGPAEKPAEPGEPQEESTAEKEPAKDEEKPEAKDNEEKTEALPAQQAEPAGQQPPQEAESPTPAPEEQKASEETSKPEQDIRPVAEEAVVQDTGQAEQPAVEAPEPSAPADPEVNLEEAVHVEEAEEDYTQEPAEPDRMGAVDDASELGPLIGIYKPVSPYEVTWEIIEQEPASAATGLKKGKVKTKRRATKGRCAWRNPVGFLGSCRKGGPDSCEPWPSDLLAVYTTTQGGDSKELSWVDGVTLLSTDSDGLISFILLIAFLRRHQELSFEVDLQTGRIHSIHSLGGLEFHTVENQVLLIEDILHINAVRAAASDAFYTAASPVPTTVDKEEGIEFTGTRGRRDEEPVPQIAKEPQLAQALHDLVTMLHEVAARSARMDEAAWVRRRVLRKSTVMIVDMHKTTTRCTDSDLFKLFTPLCDIVQMKHDAERQQAEEEDRRRRVEEEKRRRKEDERRRKEEDKRMKRQEEQRRKEEEKRQKAEARRAGKGGYGKGQSQGYAQHDDGGSGRRPAMQQAEGCSGKGKGKKGGGDQQHLQQQGGSQMHQPQPKAKARDQERGRKGRKAKEVEPGPVGAIPEPTQPYGRGYEFPNLPRPWVAVPDSNSGRLYYWNQETNDVQWDPPQPASPQQSRAGPSHQQQAPQRGYNRQQQQQQQQPQQQQQQQQQQQPQPSAGSAGGMWPGQEYFLPGQQPGMYWNQMATFPFSPGPRAPGPQHLDWQ